MTGDELAAAATTQLASGASSPFWRPRETAPAAPITESAAESADLADLAKLSPDALDAVFDRLNQRRGLASPLWRAA